MPMTAEEISSKLDMMEKDLDSVRKRAEEAEAALLVERLEPEDREAYDTLSAAEQATFVQADDDARSELLAKARSAIEKKVDPEEMPEPVRKRFEDVQKRLEQAEARANAAETVAKREQDARQMVELTKRAEEEFAGLPGTPQEKAEVLKSLTKLTETEKAACEKLLKAGNECLAGQMKPVGKGAGDATGGGGTWAKIEKRATALAAERKITVAKAVEAVITENPELYDEYLKESR